MSRFDAVIFDIDNVLIDTRASYTDCIRKTVETYLAQKFSYEPSRTPLLARRDVEIFKSLGGFNDDWDTCYGLLLYFLSLKTRRKRLGELRKKKRLSALAASVKLRPFGVKGAERAFGQNAGVSLEAIARIFQKIYLSELVWNEKVILPKPFLKILKQSGLKLAIVTGRNREEALFALRRFQMDALFDSVVTVDETPANRKKPDPYGILKTAAGLGKNLRYLYVGDLPDDIAAARRAGGKLNIKSCGFTGASTARAEMRHELKRAGADYIAGNVKELKGIILGPILRARR